MSYEQSADSQGRFEPENTRGIDTLSFRNSFYMAGCRALGGRGDECPINISLSRRPDKVKLIGHQTDPILA
jgi:hypothetical protein